MTTNKKFSELIGDLTEVWLLWMKNNTIAHDETISFSDRKKAIQECERLIDLEYTITNNLDNFFNE